MDVEVRVGWRRLAVRVSGSDDGYPVFLLHGTPGSRLSVHLEGHELERLGVRLITYDRPGYGRSDPYPGRRVADAAIDIGAIADALGHDRFAVLGRSGGGPHALAAAALLPDRVTRAASLVGLAPFDAPNLDWYGGMAPVNRREYSAAAAGRSALLKVLYPEVIALRSDPVRFAHVLFEHAPAADHGVIAIPSYHEHFLAGLVEAVEQSIDGWVADTLAFARPWGFEPSKIRVPTLLWHGRQDVFSPVSHTLWLAEQIGEALLELSDDSSHLHAASAQADAVRWLVEGGEPSVQAWPA